MENINSFIASIGSFITSPNFQALLFPIKIIFIGISLVFVLTIIILLIKSTWLKRRVLEDLIEVTTYRPYGVKKTFKQWAVIDSLLNSVLQKMGFSGETIGERLKQLKSDILPNIDQVWEAHKIRNNVVHDPDYKLTLDQAKQTVAIYEKALRDLEAF